MVDVNFVQEMIVRMYSAGYRGSFILFGDKGIGKTLGVRDVMEELAKINGKEFVLYDDDMYEEIKQNRDKYWVHIEFASSLAQPEDFLGIPKEKNGYIRYEPLAWVDVMRSGMGSVFLDEITNMRSFDKRSAMLRLFYEKMAGYVRLSNDVIVVGAGNTAEQSRLADVLDEPMRAGKTCIIEVDKPSIASWIEWMNKKYGDDWDKRVGAFLTRYPDMAYESDVDEGYEAIRRLRGWSEVAKITHKIDDEQIVEQIVRGFVGKQAMIQFMAFIKVKTPELDEIERNPLMWNTLSEEQKYMLTYELASRDNKVIIERYRNILAKMINEDREYIGLILALKTKENRKELAMLSRIKYPALFNVIITLGITAREMEEGYYEI